MIRPTPKELHHKIMAAQDSVKNGRIAFLNQTAIACDAIDFYYDIENDLLSFLPECLNGLTPDDYAGHRPPEKAYATEISGLELFAFKVNKSPFRFPMNHNFAYAKNKSDFMDRVNGYFPGLKFSIKQQCAKTNVFSFLQPGN